MKTAYKLTDRAMQTHGGFQWSLGEWRETSGKGELCGPGWLHFYDDPLLAVLLNPMHADIQEPRLFRAEATGKTLDDNGLKCGYTRARLVEEIPLPVVTTEQRVRFEILCAREVGRTPAWNARADGWLSGEGRSAAAEAAWAEAAWALAWAATRPATRPATQAAWAATQAARAATEAAEAGKPLPLAKLARMAMEG